MKGTHWLAIGGGFIAGTLAGMLVSVHFGWPHLGKFKKAA
jgi:hypothetical protein